ncbi:hypothetical protein [Nostoc sp.]|uniref:hypothetical protein n=1 Tax=Nostoc sp. TaxID=1180 RepID=UPI002FF966F1
MIPQVEDFFCDSVVKIFNYEFTDAIVKIVLDTCALIWWSLDPAKLSEQAKEACNYMERDKNGLVPSIAIWEIAIKIKKKKLDLGGQS